MSRGILLDLTHSSDYGINRPCLARVPRVDSTRRLALLNLEEAEPAIEAHDGSETGDLGYIRAGKLCHSGDITILLSHARLR
jgi:hypothetical protein